jgi:hypothetical protein
MESREVTDVTALQHDNSPAEVPMFCLLQVLLIVQYSYLTAARCMCIVPSEGGSTLQQQQYHPVLGLSGSSSSSWRRPSMAGGTGASSGYSSSERGSDGGEDCQVTLARSPLPGHPCQVTP